MAEHSDKPRAPVHDKQGLSRLISATGYSLAGLRAAWASEEAFRLEMLASLFMVPAALWLGPTMVQRALLVGSILLVLIVELLNTAVEYTLDRISTEQHSLSGRAKDMGSAAVMLSLLLCALTWGGVAWDRFSGG
jgi:diacylglycerol kinase (ATP)